MRIGYGIRNGNSGFGIGDCLVALGAAKRRKVDRCNACLSLIIGATRLLQSAMLRAFGDSEGIGRNPRNPYGLEPQVRTIISDYLYADPTPPLQYSSILVDTSAASPQPSLGHGSALGMGEMK
jgi:hypothetical protein